VKSNLERDKYLDKAIDDIHQRIDKRSGETKDLKKEMRASVLENNQGIEMLEGQIDVLDEDAATFQVQLDSLAEKACHCVDRIVPVQKREPDIVFFNPRPDLLSSEGTNHSSRAPSELEYVTPPLGMSIPLRQVTDDEMECVAPSSGPCACSHWGQGVLETSGNILGTLQALDHFSPNVSTNYIWSTSGM